MRDTQKQLRNLKCWLPAVGLMLCGILVVFQSNLAQTHALQNPQGGSIGVEGTIHGNPPSQPAVISTPGSNETVTSVPVAISGLCTGSLLVKVFDNNVFAGSTVCSNGSFLVRIDLFNGQNNIVVRMYDGLDQASPDSNTIVITYNSAQFLSFGTLLSLTSSYAKIGANPGAVLSWPLTISGGTPPYALSINWGDDSPAQLLSEAYAGQITISHRYQNSGTYTIVIQITDKNGEVGFLQVVAVVNGSAGQGVSAGSTTNSQSKSTTITKIVWWPMALFIPFLFVTFWLGRRHELYTLRKRIERSTKEL